MIQNQEFTYVGNSTEINGHLIFHGTTHVKGRLLGTISVLNSANLILEIGSFTSGILTCFDLDLYGEFIGDINSSGKVTIYPTAYFEGKIIAKKIEILPGAIVNMTAHAEE
jgi:cytoskeletal protein CcmA (bactofilin family)